MLKKGDKMDIDFEKIKSNLKRNYPVGIILRKDLEKATGGILKCRTLASRDTEGTGMPKFYVGKYAAYQIDDIITYLQKVIK
jgi:hypothetical protein